MPTIDLPHGTVRYRVAGPEDPGAPVAVLVHGFLVDSTLWAGVTDGLAEAGIRSYAPDLPLGSHRIALDPAADQSPRGVARQVLAFLAALDLDDVTLVGNDSGGALCQFLVDEDPSRVARLVLTNCDAYDQFPPAPFDRMFKLAARPSRLFAAMQPMRVTALRHSSQGFGELVAGALDPALTRAWIEPCLTDSGVRRDAAAFCAAVDPAQLDAVSKRLGRFPGAALLVWGADDPYFKVDFARRLQAEFANAKLVEVAGARTFVPLDAPARVASEIAAFVPV